MFLNPDPEILIEQLDRLYWLKQDEQGVGRRATDNDNDTALEMQQHHDTDTHSTT